MPSIVLRSIAALLALAVPLTSSGQQVSSTLSKNALAVKRKAEHLSPRAPVSVVRRGAAEEFGTFVSSNQEGFTFYDIDLKFNVTLPYEGVKKIKDGYGGMNFINHRHTDHTQAMIIITVTIGLLLVLAVAAGKS